MDNTRKKTILKIGKRVVLIGLVIGIAIQFYRPDKNIQAERTKDDFLLYEKAPESVSKLVVNSCYDCHSNYTDYKWFDHIAPGTWLVDNHIKEGKEHLNLSKWGKMDYRDKRSLLSKMATNINDGTMPLSDYTFIHTDAILSEEEKAEILTWLFTIEIPAN